MTPAAQPLFHSPARRDPYPSPEICNNCRYFLDKDHSTPYGDQSDELSRSINILKPKGGQYGTYSVSD